MTVTAVNLQLLIRASITKVDGSACGLQTAAIWFPVAPSVTTLPPAPPPTINPTPIPPESAPIPPGFNYDSPNLCDIFDNILAETNDAVYAQELDVENLILPFNERVNYEGLLRTYVNMFRYNYTLKRRQGEASPVLKLQPTGVRLYKIKCEVGSLGLTGVDAKIFPERKLVSQPGSIQFLGANVAILPARLFADRGIFVLSGIPATVAVPGTFSYGWSSTSATSAGNASPIGIGYRRLIHRSLYSQATLLANGARAGARFVNLRWYVTSAINPNNSIRGMNIRLFHSTATTANYSLVPISGETKTVVYSDADTVEFTQAETTGVLQIDFAVEFQWNGINSIVIENCTAQNQTNYASQGAVRIDDTPTTLSRVYALSDSTGTSCNSSPGQGANSQISVQMDYI